MIDSAEHSTGYSDWIFSGTGALVLVNTILSQLLLPRGYSSSTKHFVPNPPFLPLVFPKSIVPIEQRHTYTQKQTEGEFQLNT